GRKKTASAGLGAAVANERKRGERERDPKRGSGATGKEGGRSSTYASSLPSFCHLLQRLVVTSPSRTGKRQSTKLCRRSAVVAWGSLLSSVAAEPEEAAVLLAVAGVSPELHHCQVLTALQAAPSRLWPVEMALMVVMVVMVLMVLMVVIVEMVVMGLMVVMVQSPKNWFTDLDP
ncbi:hypothetical protein PIB30_074123, partial [Stylosanthes scabra]|nr:hypothetical protein [Stylosanthes scabra]